MVTTLTQFGLTISSVDSNFETTVVTSSRQFVLELRDVLQCQGLLRAHHLKINDDLIRVCPAFSNASQIRSEPVG